ncbi:MAG TPA: DUF2252 domain-containing protein [Acetobacteraceae bacterium]|jgi:uncharacterized protein (DUF2252 family)|nr:DUF2252 domain-containing protein [Acetobacteraceae bacterium]
MPLEYVQPDDLLSMAERRQAGHDLRRLVPRGQHATWHPPAERCDPLQILAETSRHRISSLLPIRYGRMQPSAFAFMRGSAAVMAADLAMTPTSGIWVQSCGDCHSANFGTYSASDGTSVFDITDFDETLPAPFEWDLKRLATSFAVDARGRRMPERACRNLARCVVAAYRRHMSELMRLDPVDAWRSRVDVTGLLQGIADARLRQRELKRLRLATEAHCRGYPRLIEHSKSGWRIRQRPPLITPLSGQHDDTHELVARTAFESYKLSLPEERGVLLDRFRLADVAFKVVGIGSVGTFCAIGLFITRDGATLLLQLKEAQVSVLAPFAAPSLYANQGQRVVTGQRIMQGQRDIFLGWTQEHGSDQYCYVRQLKDPRLAVVGTELASGALPYYAALCGSTLARAHARSGDAARIAGYMGSGGAFDTAIADFAMAYAEQVEHDWRAFVEAIKAGAIEARDE